MSTPVLNNGLFSREIKVQASKIIDELHLRNIYHDAKPTNLGPVDIFAMSKRREPSLYNLAMFNKKNTFEVDSITGQYSWQIPIATELPQVVEDMDPTNTRKGIGRTKFQIKFNKLLFDHNHIITYDKMNGVELIVTEDEIIPAGDNYIYTVMIVNGPADQYLDNKYLAPGTRYFIKSSYINEHTQKTPTVFAEGGYREFFNYVGDHQVGREKHFTERAVLMQEGLYNRNNPGEINCIEIWAVHDKLLDPSVASVDDIYRKLGKDGIVSEMKSGGISRMLITKVEAKMLSEIQQDVENYLMFGQGGFVETDGPKKGYLSPGIWKQTDNGYKITYRKQQFSLDFFRTMIYNFLNGKEVFDKTNPSRKFVVHTGLGGINLINKAIGDKAFTAGFTINASENLGIGAIRGKDPLNLKFGYFFTSVVFPGISNVEFVINPALDVYNANDIENPIIDGHRLSSYSFLIFDIDYNQENDNINLVKWKYSSEVRWRYVNGTMDYLGRNVFQSSGDFTGFKVNIRQTAPAIWIKDPTKIMKMVMINPITGKSL